MVAAIGRQANGHSATSAGDRHYFSRAGPSVDVKDQAIATAVVMPTARMLRGLYDKRCAAVAEALKIRRKCSNPGRSQPVKRWAPGSHWSWIS